MQRGGVDPRSAAAARPRPAGGSVVAAARGRDASGARAVVNATAKRPLFAGTVVAVISALALSVNDVLIPLLYRSGTDAQSVVTLRYVFFIVVMSAAILITRSGFAYPRKLLPHAVISGALSAIGSLGLLGAFERLPLGLAILIVYTYPVLTALFQAAIERRAPSLTQFACLLVALGGVALSLDLTDAKFDMLGLAFGAISSIGFAASIVWNGHKLATAPPLTTSLYMTASGLVLALAASFGLDTASRCR